MTPGHAYVAAQHVEVHNGIRSVNRAKCAVDCDWLTICACAACYKAVTDQLCHFLCYSLGDVLLTATAW
jgi:hypothetical protein